MFSFPSLENVIESTTRQAPVNSFRCSFLTKQESSAAHPSLHFVNIRQVTFCETGPVSPILKVSLLKAVIRWGFEAEFCGLCLHLSSQPIEWVRVRIVHWHWITASPNQGGPPPSLANTDWFSPKTGNKGLHWPTLIGPGVWCMIQISSV